MTTNWSRRQTLKTALGTVAAALGPSQLWAASKTLNILAHKVHQVALTEGPGGDQTGGWRSANDADLSWTTFDSIPLQDRLFREASLPQSDFSLGFVSSNRVTPDVARLFEPLDAYQANKPIEDFSDISVGLSAAMRFDGKLMAVPFRHATQALYYNEALLEERGIKAPPSTVEELVEQAKQLTFKSAAGVAVTGMVLASDLTPFPITFVRAYGGDFIAPDLTLLPNPDAMEKALTTLQQMFAAGSLPRSYATTNHENQVTWMQQGRAAFTVMTFARYVQMNRPDQSKYPGRIKAMEFPISEALRGKQSMSSVTDFWSMVILGNARNKELAWDFIRAMSSKATTVGAARNGNGPVRVSAYADPHLTSIVPYAAAEAKALANARLSVPAFAEAARAQAVFMEELQLTVVGRKTPKAAIASMRERVTPLLKK